MMTWLVRVVVGLIVIGIVVFIVGSLLPQNHTASRTANFSQPPETVWAAMTDVAAFPSWRSDVATVAQLAPQNDKPVWRETSHRGEHITYAAETWDPPRHLVTRITDKNLPFGGTGITRWRRMARAARSPSPNMERFTIPCSRWCRDS